MHYQSSSRKRSEARSEWTTLIGGMDEILTAPNPPLAGLEAITHHANTQAIILTYYRTLNPKVMRFSKPVYVRPQERAKWRKMKQDRIRVYAARLEADDYTKEHPSSCATALEVLLKYRTHRVLYGERFHAKHYPFKRNNTNFMDLPGEIRNSVSRLALVLDEPVEFAPKTYYNNENEGPVGRLLYQHRKELWSILRIVRVGKQISSEATDIFSGENEFRFTNLLGWYVLHSFLTAFGTKNVARLGQLSVCVLWRGLDYEHDTWDATLVHGTGIGEKLRAAASKKMNLPVRTTSHLRFEQARLVCIDMLHTCRDIRILRFILPHHYHFTDAPSIPQRYSYMMVSWRRGWPTRFSLSVSSHMKVEKITFREREVYIMLTRTLRRSTRQMGWLLGADGCILLP
ncbi:hypothetical protein DOTSEDRAFT_72187 [Dothistroma septosporum NZE10]|uniref:Uncharacterized protein n=1 Tax=Dothistroma septosporum (strain NZE10 / CBS 128990) TaxID=675120 RepID=N1PQL8_DOTSN|nr:hypothetical protein DOTSEDRAFT_72187 [Dothistroma septosporum NZE10]